MGVLAVLDETKGHTMTDLDYSVDGEQLRMPESMSLEVNRVELERMCFACEYQIDNSAIFLQGIKTVQIETFRHCVMSVRAHVLGYKNETIVIKHHKSVWEQFKERWMPKWFLKRFPVQWTEIKIDARVLYPFIKAPLNNSPYVILYKRQS